MAKTKSRKKSRCEEVEIELPQHITDALVNISELSGKSVSDVVNVILAMYVMNEAHFLDDGK